MNIDEQLSQFFQQQAWLHREMFSQVNLANGTVQQRRTRLLELQVRANQLAREYKQFLNRHQLT